MNSLELFSGSKNISTVLMAHKFSTWSVDNNPKLNPSICCDIMDLDYSLLPGQFHFIWASPDCRYFSRIGNSKLWAKKVIKYRQYEYTPLCYDSARALLLLYKTIEIIKHFNPVCWFIENPVGRMRHIPELKNFAPFRYGINYKNFGTHYSKETDIYSNVYLNFGQKKVVIPGSGVLSVNSRYERSKVPALLIESILQQCSNLQLINI